MLQFSSFEVAMQALPGIAPPEPWQLDQVNQQRPKGTVEYTADDLLMVPALASHNLMCYSNCVWDSDSLAKMAELYPGRPMELNHDWEHVESCVGLISSAYHVQTPDAPTNILNAADFFDVNRSIVANQGFQFLVVYAAFPVKNAAIIDAIKYRLTRDVSTGGMTDGTWICPLCNGEFFTEDCDGHMPPHPMLLWWYENDEDVTFAPYYIRTGFLAAIEVSHCVTGNLPGAEILSAVQSIATVETEVEDPKIAEVITTVG